MDLNTLMLTIIHYSPTPESDTEVKPEGFLLVDSGGQYKGGTTDITRTIAVGPLTEEMKTNLRDALVPIFKTDWRGVKK